MLLAILTVLGFLWTHHHGFDATATTATWIRPCFLMPKKAIHSFRRPDGTSTFYNIFTGMHMQDALSDTGASATNPNTNHGDTNTASVSLPSTRCSSRDAASIIRNCSATDGLLIITCDASGRGGGSKHDGVASILRIRHGASYLPETIPHYTKGSQDLIDAFARRSIPSRTSSEVAAISFGMKCALRNIPLSWRQQVLVLSDSEFAIDFFTHIGTKVLTASSSNTASQKGRVGSNRMKGRKKVTPSSMELRGEAHRRTLLSLIKETPRGVLFSKVRSSSRGVRIKDVNFNNDEAENDTSWNGIGFIDHDAADHLSSVIRSSVNSNNTCEAATFGVSNVAEPLGWEDFRWLVNSESHQLPLSQHENACGGSWQLIEVVGNEARCERNKRNRRRIERIERMIGLLRCNYQG